MPCYSPNRVWRGGVLPSGKLEILFRRPKVEKALDVTSPMKLPCQRCIGCKLEYSRQWAMRCMHEASLWPRNCFITLTYDDAHLPVGGGLVKRDWQLFMKRLRKDAEVDGIRFFMCGEYGEVCERCEKSRKICVTICGRNKFIPSLGRPHFHACLFNFNFTDLRIHRRTERGDILYRSATLEKLWPNGHSMIGSVTFESAAYVARYVTKKISGAPSDMHYLNKKTGEIRLKEFVLMSRGSKKLGTGGIGRGWYDKYKFDVFPRDYAILRGKMVRPPKFYSSLFEIDDPIGFARVKSLRIQRACKLDPSGRGESGDVRLRVKEEVKIAQLRSLSRNLEV